MIEASSGGAGLYSSVFVVLKHTGGFQPILNLKWFNHYLHIPSFKMPTIRICSSLFSMVIMFSPFISRILIYVFLLLNIIIFFTICLTQYAISVEGFTLWVGHSPRVFTALTKPILFLSCCKGFHIVIYLDDIFSLVCSKLAGERAHSFLCSLLVCHGLYINFSKSDLHLIQTFCFLGLC